MQTKTIQVYICPICGEEWDKEIEAKRCCLPFMEEAKEYINNRIVYTLKRLFFGIFMGASLVLFIQWVIP